MGENPALSAVIADKIITFLTDNSWQIVLVISIIIFRNALSQLLKRIISFDFSFGGAKGRLKATASEQKAGQPEKIYALEEKIETKEIKSEEKQIEAKEKEDWFSAMREAFSNREFHQATSIFETYINGETDNDKKIQNEAIYLYFLYSKAGDKSAIARLQRLIEKSTNDEQKNRPLFWLSLCYERSKNYIEAEKLWFSAIAEATDESKKTYFIRNLAYVYKDNNEADRAIRLLEERIADVKTDEERTIVYKAISDIEKKRGNELVAALALEKVIERNPDDKDVLFDAAYSQANSELLFLAINNYDTLIRLDPENSTALNNLGVAVAKINLELKATEMYKRSVEKGNTLAMANLAQRYLNIGLVEEADGLIKKALESDEPHENVPEVLSRIKEKQESEKTEWNNVLTIATNFRNFMRSYTSAYFNEYSQLGKFSGVWVNDDGQEVEFNVQNHRLMADWIGKQVGLSITAYKHTLSGTVHNNSAVLEYKREPVDKTKRYSLLGSFDTVSLDCYAYITQDHNEMHITAQYPRKDCRLKFRKQNT